MVRPGGLPPASRPGCARLRMFAGLRSDSSGRGHRSLIWPWLTASGLGGHRALTDCLYLAEVFRRCDDLELLIERGLEPRCLMRAQVSYDDRHLAREAGFRWNDPVKGAWVRRLSEREAEELAFLWFPSTTRCRWRLICFSSPKPHGGLPRDGFCGPGWIHGLRKAFTHGSFTPAAMAAGADLGKVDSRGRMSLACGCPRAQTAWSAGIGAAVERGAGRAAFTRESLAHALCRLYAVALPRVF